MQAVVGKGLTDAVIGTNVGKQQHRVEAIAPRARWKMLQFQIPPCELTVNRCFPASCIQRPLLLVRLGSPIDFNVFSLLFVQDLDKKQTIPPELASIIRLTRGSAHITMSSMLTA